MSLGKRKRWLSNLVGGQLHQAIAEQFDLEIALRKRLFTAATARLEWAHILRSSIAEKDCNTLATGYPGTAFRDAALATYEAIEDPCRFIVFNPDKLSRHHINGRATIFPDTRAIEPSRTRKRITTGPAIGPLIFEDNSTTEPVMLKLVCPDCSRSDFPTMQGFLNHCRLAHQQNYGTHDECIQACGVIIEPDEKEALIAAGVEIKTIHLPSLKRIFERAVGLQQHVSTGVEDTQTHLVDQPPQTSTHLSQTLGLHKDTPTLAPFLGKKVKKKTIHVYDEGEVIDIVELDDDLSSKSRPPWIFKRRPMRRTEDKLLINMTAVAAEKKGEIKSLQHPSGVKDTSDQGSRFHIMRRILVSDKSLYLASTRRPSDPDTMFHTHRWQISVTSPSYEQHISTFLMCLTVVCATHPPVFKSPIIVSEPPFVACSTTDRPFLARLTLKWVGEKNNDFVVEHWVELDQLKATRPVLGEEQILDVELDRNTIFRPMSTALGPAVSWTGEGDYESSRRSVSPKVGTSAIHNADSVVSGPPHMQLLKSIVPRFPITLQDLGSRHSVRVPYVVHASPAKFLSLVLGRRKAIEWSRASAIRSEYDTLITSPSSSSRGYVHLTTADVYRWLESEGHFPRHRPKGLKVQKAPMLPDSSLSTPLLREVKTEPLFCSVCGVNVCFHSPGILLKQGEGEPNGFHCSAELERRRAPLVHVSALILPLKVPSWAHRLDQSQHNIKQINATDIIMLIHPHMTQFTRTQVKSLQLSRSDTAGSSHELCFGRSRGDVEDILAPYALLGAVVEMVVRDLIGSSLQAARESQYQTMTAYGRTLGNNLKSLLTPTHVLQGLLKSAEVGGAKEALFKCFARLGTLLEAVHDGGVAATFVEPTQ